MKSEFEIQTGGDSCARVTVEKEIDVPSGYVQTIIESRGYNICAPGNPRILQRAVKVVF